MKRLLVVVVALLLFAAGVFVGREWTVKPVAPAAIVSSQETTCQNAGKHYAQYIARTEIREAAAGALPSALKFHYNKALGLCLAHSYTSYPHHSARHPTYTANIIQMIVSLNPDGTSPERDADGAWHPLLLTSYFLTTAPAGEGIPEAEHVDPHQVSVAEFDRAMLKMFSE
jgi:hypothetical protein